MIASFFSFSWVISATIIPFVASLGGVFVFWGLWLEGPPDPEEFSDIDAFRRHKVKSKKGWKILMVGIFLEIVVAFGLAVKEGWQARTTTIQIAKNDPLNQPVNDIVVNANFILKTNRFLGATMGLDLGTSVELLESNYANSNSPRTVNLGSFSTLFSEQTVPGSVSDNTGTHARLLVQFKASSFAGPIQNGVVISNMSPLTPKDVMQRIQVLKFRSIWIPSDAELIGDTAQMFVNGKMAGIFKIFPKKADGRKPGEFEFYATNAVQGH